METIDITKIWKKHDLVNTVKTIGKTAAIVIWATIVIQAIIFAVNPLILEELKILLTFGLLMTLFVSSNYSLDKKTLINLSML